MTNDTTRIREITTSKGTKVVLLDWITGRELQQINSPMFSAMKVKPSQGGMETSAVTMDISILMDNEAVKTIVKSINGQNEGILDLVLDLPVDEYNEVMTAVRETLNGKKN